MAKEYIEKEAVGQTVLELPSKIDDDGYVWVLRRDAFRAVADFPAADVRENVEGEWIWKPSNYVMCSICGYERKMELSLQRGWIIPKFCEDCGAQMGGAEDGK